MSGTQIPLRRRAYANMCRDFIEAASPRLIDILENGEDTVNLKLGLKNIAYCLRAPVPYYFEDSTLQVMIFLSYFDWPRALLAAEQDRIAIKFADKLAQRITGQGAFSTDLIRRYLPTGLRTGAGLDYAQGHKLKGLERLIKRSLD